MTYSQKWLGIGLGTMTAMALALGVAVALPTAASAHGGIGGFAGARGGLDGTALATALGITVEQLNAAQKKVADAALDKAVADGQLTQAQADMLKLREGMHVGKLGGTDAEAALAKELGITVDQLSAARSKAVAAELDKALAAGTITQAQADQMKAHQALRDYLAKQGLDDKVKSLREQALKDAVAAGVLTQAQADALQNGAGFGMRGFGGRHGRGFGIGRGLAPALPGGTTPAQPNGSSTRQVLPAPGNA
jgi:hypothetical protein